MDHSSTIGTLLDRLNRKYGVVPPVVEGAVILFATSGAPGHTGFETYFEGLAGHTVGEAVSAHLAMLIASASPSSRIEFVS